MRTLREKTAAFDSLGADLSDRYAKKPRAVDVCGIACTSDGRFQATFWHWEWPSPADPLEVSAIADEVRIARAAMLDGPQALAAIGQSMRECERECGAVGKTPSVLPTPGPPFAGYIRSSVELFDARGLGASAWDR